MSDFFLRVANKFESKSCHSSTVVFVLAIFLLRFRLGVTGIVNLLTLLTWLRCSVLQTSSGVTVYSVNKV